MIRIKAAKILLIQWIRIKAAKMLLIQWIRIKAAKMLLIQWIRIKAAKILLIQWIRILCTDQNKKILCSVKKNKIIILPPSRLFIPSWRFSTFSARASRSRSSSGSWSSSPDWWITWIPSAWHINLEKKRIVQIRPEFKLYKLIEGILCTMLENVFLVSLSFFTKFVLIKQNTK